MRAFYAVGSELLQLVFLLVSYMSLALVLSGRFAPCTRHTDISWYPQAVSNSTINLFCRYESFGCIAGRAMHSNGLLGL